MFKEPYIALARQMWPVFWGYSFIFPYAVLSMLIIVFGDRAYSAAQLRTLFVVPFIFSLAGVMMSLVIAPHSVPIRVGVLLATLVAHLFMLVIWFVIVWLVTFALVGPIQS